MTPYRFSCKVVTNGRQNALHAPDETHKVETVHCSAFCILCVKFILSMLCKIIEADTTSISVFA